MSLFSDEAFYQVLRFTFIVGNFYGGKYEDTYMKLINQIRMLQ